MSFNNAMPTFVLSVEGTVPAAPAERVGLGVSLTIERSKVVK
jgi:hypothetical protein